MKKEQALDLMTAIDPGLIEEADLPMPSRRRLPKLVRAGLIAACLCLALAGTAAAAVASGWITVSESTFFPFEHRDGGTRSAASVRTSADGTVYMPLENFSQEALDYANSFLSLPQYRGFDSWDEVEEFLGLEIADNAVLDRAQFYTHPDIDYSTLPGYHLPGHPTDDSGRGWTTERNCLVGFHGRTDSPDLIDVRATYQMEEAGGSLYLSVYTYMSTQPSPRGEWGNSFGFRDTEEPVTEHYVTPSGLQAVIVTARALQYDYAFCYASFQLNGAYFILSTNHTHAEQMVRTVKEVLDAYS